MVLRAAGVARRTMVFQLSSNMNAFPLINRPIVSLLPKTSPAESGPPATFIGVNKASLGFRCIRTICPSVRCHASLTTFPASEALMVSAVLPFHRTSCDDVLFPLMSPPWRLGGMTGLAPDRRCSSMAMRETPKKVGGASGPAGTAFASYGERTENLWRSVDLGSARRKLGRSL